jgi:3-isopropylmalate/(R)-2-methylmalate dehydratase small subunit
MVRLPARDGTDDPAFVLNQPRYRGARISAAILRHRQLLAKWRWAIAGMGIRCLIAPSYGQIFYGNCFQNGLLPIVLPAPTVEALMKQASAPGAKPFTVDLEAQTINGTTSFDISPRRRKMLMEGLDEVGLTLAMEPKIAAFEAADRARRPWIYPPT